MNPAHEALPPAPRWRLRRSRAGATLAALLALTLACLARPAAAQPAGGRAAAPLPAMIPLFPLPEPVLFPNGSRPLVIYEPRYRTMVAEALKGDRIIGMVTLRPGFEADYEGRPPIHAVGCAGRITEVEQLPDGRYTLVLEGLTRFRVQGEDQTRAYRLGRVEALPEAPPTDDGSALRSDRRRLETILSTQGIDVSIRTSNDGEIIDVLSQYLEMAPGRRQMLLELDGPAGRARALIDLLTAR